MKKLIKFTLLYILAFTSILNGQINESSIREFFDNPSLASHFNSYKQVKEFYSLRGFRPVWTNEEEMHQLLVQISHADNLGLDKNDYQSKLISSIESGTWYSRNLQDSLLRETSLTDAAIHFLFDISTGSTTPYFAYNGLKSQPDYQQLLRTIQQAFEEKTITTILQELEPISPEYRNLKSWMNHFQYVAEEPGFKDAIVISSRADSSNKPLLKRLQQLSLLDTIPKNISSKEIIGKIKSAQWLFNLLPDGVLRSTIVSEMNKPFQYRIEELKMALNTIRWFMATTSSSTIVVVNIPSANLLVYDRGKVILESKVIVGKPSTPTSTLCSRITEVILYPYWIVPKKIATQELLPIIKTNVGYLDANAIQVINLQGKIVNPYSINWNELSSSYFPYTLRQSTGCDNSLGLVKLNFYNPFTTYLHDTPWKYLFSFNKRYFSHGCVRVEKAVELARLILKDNQQLIDTVIEKGCLRDQPPITIQASNTILVFVIYQTAWVDSSGIVKFDEDIYQRFRHLQPVSRLTNKSLAVK